MNYILLSGRLKRSQLLFSLFLGMILLGSQSLTFAGGVTLYTPYTKISVPPGESIDYSVDIINNTGMVQNVQIQVSGMPKDWTYDMKSGGWNVNQISILPKEKKTLSLKVEVPLKVNKGNYQFRIVAPGLATLPLTVVISQQGTYKTEFSSSQTTMQGQANANFKYSATLRNRTAEKQLYALTAETPQGWEVTFKADYKQVTSVEIEPNNTSNIIIEVNPPDNMEAGTYQIPVKASSNSTYANIDLNAVITGSYKMELTTPEGLLSSKITAGHEKQITLVIKNTGSSDISNVQLSSQLPADWEVKFEPKQVDKVIAGRDFQVQATVKASGKSIPGDYMANFEAKTSEISSKAAIRFSVETSMLWGWVGALIIIIAIGCIYSLFRKYGRR
jgi:uncharacterized membrane protein